jgi:hypothetical protein
MTRPRTAAVIGVIVAVCLSAIGAVVVLVPSGVPGCGEGRLVNNPPKELTPEEPVLIPLCGEYPVRSGSIVFSIDSSAHFVGAWRSPAPLAVAVLQLNATYTGWPCPGCYGGSGTLNVTLPAGTWALAIVPSPNAPPETVITATQEFEVVFH